MPKFFCDYCDVYLTHDSMSVRKAHNSGRNHLRNVIDYYQQIGHEKAQSVIDSITSSYAAEGQAHNNPMLPQNQPGGGAGAFPPTLPFSFPPGGGPPPPFPGMPGAPPPPFGQFPPPPGGAAAGRGGVPPMPFMPNPNGGPPIPPPGGLPFPLPAGMPPFPLPPGGAAAAAAAGGAGAPPGPAGSPPANFPFPPPQHMPQPFGQSGGPPGHGEQR